MGKKTERYFRVTHPTAITHSPYAGGAFLAGKSAGGLRADRPQTPVFTDLLDFPNVS